MSLALNDLTEPGDFDLGPWEPLVMYTLVRKLRLGLALPLAVVVFFVFPRPNHLVFAIPATVVGLYGIVAYIRGTANLRQHPFLQMLAWQHDQVIAIYLFYTSVNGFRAGPFLTLLARDDEQRTIMVPEAEAAVWLGRLRAAVPNAEYREGQLPPPSLSLRSMA